MANLLIDGKFPTSAAQSDNQFIAIRSLSRRSARYTKQIALAKTRLKDELSQAGLGRLKVFEKQAVFNKSAMELMKQYPLPGCGETLMPIVLSEVGDINRFASADKFVGYAGMAPVEHESGPYKGEKHLKKGGCRRLSYACYLIAHHARRKDERLKNL